jgi:hypothetical protein
MPTQSLAVEILKDVGIFALIGSSFLAIYSMFYRRGCTKLQETYLWIIGHVRKDMINLRKSQSFSDKTAVMSLFEKTQHQLLQEKCSILINEYSKVRSKRFKLIWETWVDLKLVPFELLEKDSLNQAEFTQLQEFYQTVISTQNSLGRTTRYITMYELQRLKQVERIHTLISQNAQQLPLTGTPTQNLNNILTLYDGIFEKFEKDLIPIQKNERINFWVIVLKFMLSLVIPIVLNMIVVPLLISIF